MLCDTLDMSREERMKQIKIISKVSATKGLSLVLR